MSPSSHRVPSHDDDARLAALRARYQTETPHLSIERAALFTEAWARLEGTGVSRAVQVASSMRHVYEHMTHTWDPLERIAGNWTEHFLGLPLDIERGLFNGVLETELDVPSMIAYQAKGFARLGKYLLSRGLGGIREAARVAMTMGSPPSVTMGLATLDERDVNSFQIAPEDERRLQRELLPYWKGRTMADIVEEAVASHGLLGADTSAFEAALPKPPSRQALILGLTGAMATYQGHLILDFPSVLSKGLIAMKTEIADDLGDPTLDDEARTTLEAMSLAIEGVMIYAKRLAEHLEWRRSTSSSVDERRALDDLVSRCRRVPLHPAETFTEAIQAIWTVGIAVELAHITNVHAYGRLDQLLGPYYEHDSAAGRIDADGARVLLEELLLKIMVRNLRPESNLLGSFYLRYEGSTPVTIGGVTREGADATTPVTHLLLEAAHRSQTVTSVVLRIHEGTPQTLYDRAAAMLYEGSSNLSFMADEHMIPAMEQRGFSLEDARDYAITGCTDAICPGKTGGISFSGLLLCRVLDATLRRGDGKTPIGTIRGVGPRTPDPDEMGSFQELIEALEHQAGAAIDSLVATSNLRDRLFAEHRPAPHISAFVQGCRQTRRDVTRGGAVYDYSGINMINSVANLVDSLHVIRTLVFEERSATVAQLLEAADDNFVGHEVVLALVEGVEGRWGSGDALVDDLARDVISRLFARLEGHRSFRGGPFVPFVNSMTSHTMDGRLGLATIDGRRASAPYAASCNPYNVEARGLTGVLRSVARLDLSPSLGMAVNVRLHPSAIGKSLRTRRKLADLIRAYIAMGGVQLQPTVASAETLREAQRHPDRHRGLIVKVGGYSTYFVGLGREIQDEIIARTEHCPR